MKKFNLVIIIVLSSFLFSSCSSNDAELPEEQSTVLLENYLLKRDATGAYSIDLNVGEDVIVDKVVNSMESTNEIYLSESYGKVAQKTSYSTDLRIENESFKINFISENDNKIPSITVYDDNIKFLSKSGENGSMLKDYTISKNEDGTFELNFNVNNKVEVDFVYNEELLTHEIHLEEGNSKESKFSRTIEKEEGELLKIDFVSHTNNANAKAAVVAIRKPRVIVSDGDDG